GRWELDRRAHRPALRVRWSARPLRAAGGRVRAVRLHIAREPRRLVDREPIDGVPQLMAIAAPPRAAPSRSGPGKSFPGAAAAGRRGPRLKIRPKDFGRSDAGLLAASLVSSFAVVWIIFD